MPAVIRGNRIGESNVVAALWILAGLLRLYASF